MNNPTLTLLSFKFHIGRILLEKYKHNYTQQIYIQSMDRSSRDSCEICKKKFGGVFSNQHQCKRCTRTICKQCCTKKKSIFTKLNTKMQEHRCCDMCWPESEYIAQYIKTNSLVFNTLSKEGKQWGELADIDLMENKSLPKPTKSKPNPVYFLDVWTNMTPSLRQLSGLLVNKIAITNVDNCLKNIYERVSNVHMDLTVGLVVYLLCHCDERVTAKIFNYLFKIVQNIDEKQLGSHIQQLCAGDIAFDQKNTKSLVNYAKNVYKSYTHALFINCLQIDIVHHIFLETMLSGDSQVIQLTFACIIYEFKALILSDRFDDKSLKSYIWQNVGLKSLEKSVKKLRKLIMRKNNVQKKANEVLKKQEQAQKKEEDQKKLAEQTKKQVSPQKSSKLSDDLKQPTQKMQKTQQINPQLAAKLTQAAEFIKKLQSGELHDEEFNLNDIDSLDRYLDSVIEQNDRSLKQCELFDKLLNSIEQQLYQGKTNTSN